MSASHPDVMGTPENPRGEGNIVSEAAGEKNAYRCETCGGVVVTVNVVEGTTPMMLGCRATEGCGGRMISMMYRLPLDLLARAPDFEWYRPTRKKLRRESDEVRDHVARGGLLLRPAL